MERVNPDRFTFFSLNAYLVPSFFLKPGEEKYCIKLPERAAAIAQISSQYSLVSLQELWGPCTKSIERQLSITHDVSGFWSTGWDLIDIALSWGSGALWYAYQKNVFTLVSTFSQKFYATNNAIHQKSFTFHLFDLNPSLFSSPTSAKRILSISLHLDPTNDNGVIKKQLAEVMTRLLEWMRAYDGPTEELIVLLNGDFNMDSRSDIYEEFVGLFAPDCEILDIYDKHIKANGLKEEMTFDNHNNDLVYWDYAGRIDYIYLFTRLDLTRTVSYDEESQRLISTRPQVSTSFDNPEWRRRGLENMTVTDVQPRFVEFYVPRVSDCSVMKYAKGEELSDHFAVTAEFVMK